MCLLVDLTSLILQEKDFELDSKSFDEELDKQKDRSMWIILIIITSQQDDRIIARAHNQVERLNDVTAHAEMLAITSAANYLGGKYLENCTMYVTMEPCQMCAGALYWSRISKIYYGAEDPKRGFTALGNLMHPKTKIYKGVLEHECKELLDKFFISRRNLN